MALMNKLLPLAVLLVLLGLLFRAAVATDTPAGWSEGTPAAGTAMALAEIDPVALTLPPAVADAVEGDTLLFYYSPLCPHCQEVMPDINRLSDAGVRVVAVASGSATEALVAEFAEAFSARFDAHIIDTDRTFAASTGARATPNVYLVRGAEAGGHEIIEAYTPFSRGMAPVFLMRRAATQGDAFAHFDGYQGDMVCRVCHQQESLSWAITHHAQAYYTLYERDRAEDLACVGCHVTGLDEPGGFVVGDHRSPLTDVTCESCHSASGPHDGAHVAASSTCESCHDAEHSINFSVAKGLPHIDHYAANGLSEVELRARMQAIADGTAAKPLLAFSEGESVGAASCKGCHKSQHRALKKGPHASAMRRLVGGDADNVACVRCHATAAASGPPSAELSGYLTGEGVGCESCHGPGGAHVEAPSVDNIVGLGDSCPECVIEAVCTSCHTPQWDPGWSLKERLKAISH
ncbi:MAG: thiol-disulfide isomerase/thioredoxin [Myxococcota bacterium]|jgi:thiol-disulfide isomerase/thioredoxin